MEDLIAHTARINEELARYGVKFGLYHDGTYEERLFPFDAIARVIPADEWEELERGLVQRVRGLNAFLSDIYNERRIIADGVIPADFVFRCPGFLPACNGIHPPKDIFSHISGIDLVHGKDGVWYVLEDNLRIPSGASYPMIARGICRMCSPRTFRNVSIRENRDYGDLLKRVFDHVNRGGINVVFTPGRYNAAYFEHSYLAEKTGAVLAEAGDLYVRDEKVYYRGFGGDVRVGAVYRRISDDYLDPTCFLPESVIGVPNIMCAYRAGNVAIINAPGNGIADDKGLYYFVPKIIECYLHETPILHNAPTYLTFYEEDRAYTLAHLDSLVIKDTAEAGGYGVMFGSKLDEQQRADLADRIVAEPRRWIAQEVVDFEELPTVIDGERVMRKADLRAFVLTGATTVVWPSGLTRYAREEGNAIVNSSQGGGFKDTWVLTD